MNSMNNMIESVNTALSSVRVLRSSVGEVFETLGNGVTAEHCDESRESNTKFLTELQELLNSLNSNLK